MCPDTWKYVREINSWMMAGAKPLSASVAAKKESRAVQTDVTWLEGDNPARPKVHQLKRRKLQRSCRLPHNKSRRQLQGRPGRSSAYKGSAEIVGVSRQRKSVMAAWSVSTSKGGNKPSVRGPPKEPDRLEKMEQDSVKLHYRFEHLLDGVLADKEMETDHVPTKSLLLFNPLAWMIKILQWNIRGFQINRDELLFVTRFINHLC